jgi:hypothetical protein
MPKRRTGAPNGRLRAVRGITGTLSSIEFETGFFSKFLS